MQHGLVYSCQKAEPDAAIRNLVVFLSRSVNLTDSPLNVEGFPRLLMSTGLCRSLDRGFRIRNRCLICLYNCSRNLRQTWLASLSQLLIFSCQPRDLLIQGMLLSLQRVHHLNKFFACRHFALYRWSSELQLFRFVSLRRIQRTKKECTVRCFNFPQHTPISQHRTVQNQRSDPGELGRRHRER